MKYLSKQVNGFNTRNNFIRSMDIAHAWDVRTALANYEKAWFSSTRKQYLNEAFKHIKEKSLFWANHVFTDMLDEIMMESSGDYDFKTMSADVDNLKSAFIVWSSRRKNQPVTDDEMVKRIKSFEAKYRYGCPDTYKSAWMNTGAYVTLCYGVKYEGLTLPGCSTPEECLSLLKKCAMEAIASMDHDVDTRMFELCHALYLSKFGGTA